MSIVSGKWIVEKNGKEIAREGTRIDAVKGEQRLREKSEEDST